MTKRKSTKRALLLSALSLLMCVSMLVGSTFAWFTDSVTSGNNIIKSGNLDVELKYTKVVDGQMTGWNSVQGATEIFDPKALWEPGRVEVVYLEVSNLGSLALKYQLGVNVAKETPGVNVMGEVFKLSDYLVFKTVEMPDALTTYTDREAAALAAGTERGLKDYNGKTTSMNAGDTDYLALIVYMPETVGNEANYRGTDVPTINLGISLVATQYTVETDSFNEFYDKDAWTEGMKVTTADELSTAIKNAKDGDVIVFANDVVSEDGNVITDKKITLDLNGKTFTVKEGASTSNRNFKINGASEVTIKNGTLVANGTKTSGAYGTIRTEGTAKVTLSNMKLYNYRGDGLNIKALSGTTVTINDTEIYSQYGGGVEAAGGIVELNNVKIEQKGMWTAPYNSMTISVNGGGKAIVNSGTYTTECLAAEDAYNQGTSHGPWTVGVLNSGGTLVINGGTFSNDNFGDDNLATAARGLVLADTGAVIEINGGTFNALKDVIDIKNNLGDASKNPSVTLFGGTFSADPTVANYSSLIKLADGYVLVDNGDGTYIILPKIEGVELSRNPDNGLYWNGNAANHKSVYYVYNGEELAKAASYFAGQNHSNEGNYVTFELMADMDMTGIEWNPWSVMFITLNGNNHTISNLSNNLFGYAGAVKINNLTLENVTSAGHQAGTFAASAEGTTLIDCVLKGNNTVTYIDEGKNENGVGAITGVAVQTNQNVTIADGATVTVNMGNIADTEKTTFDSILHGYKHTTYATNSGNIVNNGQVIVGVGNAALLEKIANAGQSVTIKLLADVTGNITVVQKANVKIAIDGNNKTYNGSITIDGKSATILTAGITIRYVNFDATAIEKDACIRLGDNANTNATRYVANLTVENCTFTGTYPSAEKVGIKTYTGGGQNLVVKKCTATKMHSLAQIHNIVNVTIEDCDIVDCKNGIGIGASRNAMITNCDMKVAAYGIRGDANEVDSALTITDCTIDGAYIPVVIRKAGTAGKAFTLTIKGTNTISNVKNTEGVWCVAGANEYGDVDKAGLTVVNANVVIDCQDTGLDANGIFIKK